METLKELPKPEWSKLRDLYRKDWPKNAVAYCLIDTNLTYPDFVEEYNFKIYCPDGDFTNGMIAVINENDYVLMVHPLDARKMEEALTSSKIIDWSRNIEVASATPTVRECLIRIEPNLEIKGDKAIKYIFNKNSPKFENLSVPPNTYVDKLRPEYIKLIDETWTYHSENSYKFFELLMKNNLTYVLYSQDHEPLAWITVDTAGALTHLFCLEGHRRKGYAEFILKTAINDQLERGKNILAYALEKNYRPQKLFEKLKFEKFGCDEWLFLKHKM